MKFLIYDLPDAFNYGSVMMVENFISYIGAKLANSSFVIVTNRPEDTYIRLNNALNYDFKINCIDYKPIFSISNFFYKEGNKIINDIESIIVLGGDVFTEDYSRLYPLYKLFQLYLLKKKGKKIYMLGQTIGPFSSWRERIVKFFISKFDKVYLREKLSFDYLYNMQLKNIFLSSDLAFLPLYRECKEDDNSFYNKLPFNIEKNNYIVIVPSELVWRYIKYDDKIYNSRTKYIEFLKNITLELLNIFDVSNIIILPFVLFPETSDDRLAGRDLYINLLREGMKKENIYLIRDPLLPYEARHIIKNSKFVVTGRMHASISSLVEKVPFLVISYSRKFHGIIKNFFELEECIIDIRDYNSYDDLFNESLRKIEILYSKYESFSELISYKLKNAQDAVLSMLYDILRDTDSYSEC